MSDPTREALAELEDWKAGRRSWTNLGPNPPYTPDVIAVMDAQEVVKLSAYVQALAALSTTPAPLDVERLARPFEGGNYLQAYDHRTSRWLDAREAAEAIAREYAKPIEGAPHE